MNKTPNLSSLDKILIQCDQALRTCIPGVNKAVRTSPAEKLEEQVSNHLKSHLLEIPEADPKTKAILEQMIVDEERHGKTAKKAGGAELPGPVQLAMKMMAKVMKSTTYRI